MSVPRVTEILKYYSSYEKVPHDILERAAARGSSVHALCAGIAHGNWIPETMINEELKGYVQSFTKWSATQVSKFLVIEKRYTDNELQYSGQVDFVVLGSDDNLYLIDLKTSARPQKTYPVQMAAYQHLLRVHKVPVKAAILVYLDKDGEFPEVHLMEDLWEELSVFISALHCYNYFNKGKKNDGN
jgi:hypothetical protein